MHKFPIFNYKRKDELPFAELDKQRFAIYIIDLEWNCVFANSHVFHMHNFSRDALFGKDLWMMLNERMDADMEFREFLKTVQSGKPANVTTVSAFNKKRVSVTGYPLEDCYYFAVTVLPQKDCLIDEIREELKRNRKE